MHAKVGPGCHCSRLITNEMSIYMKAESLFGKSVAIRQKNTRAPGNIL